MEHELPYEDDQCVYYGGEDPRLYFGEEGDVAIRLDDDGITIRPAVNRITGRAHNCARVTWGKAEIMWVGWRRTAVAIFVKHPEYSYIWGYSSALFCRNYYHAAVLAKQIAARYDCELERLEMDVALF